MTTSSNLRSGSVQIDKLFEMINQEFTAQGTRYLVLPSLGICWRDFGGLKSYEFSRMLVQFFLCPNDYEKRNTKDGDEKINRKQ